MIIITPPGPTSSSSDNVSSSPGFISVRRGQDLDVISDSVLSFWLKLQSVVQWRYWAKIRSLLHLRIQKMSSMLSSAPDWTTAASFILVSAASHVEEETHHAPTRAALIYLRLEIVVKVWMVTIAFCICDLITPCESPALDAGSWPSSTPDTSKSTLLPLSAYELCLNFQYWDIQHNNSQGLYRHHQSCQLMNTFFYGTSWLSL